MKYLLGCIVCALGWGQTAFIPTVQLCPSGQIGSYTITGAVGTLSLVKFTCIQPPATTPCVAQVAHVETFTPPIKSITLAEIPLPNTALIGYFTSSTIGFDKFLAIPNPQQNLSIALPDNLSPTDSITIVYWAAK